MTLAGLRHWGHDREHPEAFAGLESALAAELDPSRHPVYVLEEHGEVLAFYELRDRGSHIELLRMFMRPDRIGTGLGRVLWDHATRTAARSHDRVLIMSDPGAVGFYQAMGAQLVEQIEVAPGFLIGKLWFDLTGVPGFRPQA